MLEMSLSRQSGEPALILTTELNTNKRKYTKTNRKTNTVAYPRTVVLSMQNMQKIHKTEEQT